ncbi:MAG: hypothetical protein A2Y57_04435 [Candidatus Woykebacteria bacterium RBG_13_40_7b]|uniref:Diacylglycerol kinase n=1 Tax=Candidatus Woykebacteria bacterium RBG_13_40_7b TaxID=1802594 RepID=A0A1G1W7U5_9BACT|nr:MAG: hypothetical protein A2Y57_04435 [Candidatus Woykebacteria bacterium RBG_13_40_7b]
MVKNFPSRSPLGLNESYQGLREIFLSQRNFRIQLFIAFITILAGFIFGISFFEWLVLLILIALVLGFEVINTGLEKTLDLVEKDLHEDVRIAKDISAGAVLLVSIAAALAGLLIFLPKIIRII